MGQPIVPTIISTDDFATGELAGVATATQLPDVPCYLFRVKAAADNSGVVSFGKSTVTLPDGTTTTTAGYELAAGQVEDFYSPNMNLWYRICTGTGDSCTYIAYN